MGLKKNLTLLSAVLLLPAFVATADAARFEAVEADVRYFASHPMHDVEGVSKVATGSFEYDPSSPLELDGLIGKYVQVPWKSFDSGNKNRDANVLDTVGAARYPLLTLVIEGFDGLTRSGDRLEGTLRARMYVNGAKRQVESPVTLLLGDDTVTAQATFEVKMTDFGMKPPSLMFVSAGDDVRIQASVGFKRVDEAPEADTQATAP